MPAASVKALATPSRKGLSVCAIKGSTFVFLYGLFYMAATPA
jgi:hypothetical protein